jgi:hypothetical protein
MKPAPRRRGKPQGLLWSNCPKCERRDSPALKLRCPCGVWLNPKGIRQALEMKSWRAPK